MRVLVLSIALALGAGLATPAAARETIRGAGAQSCRIWIRDRQSHQTDEMADEEWVLGNVSGAAAFTFVVSGKDILKETDPDAIFAWIDDYCRARPRDLIAYATGMFAAELQRRAGVEAAAPDNSK